VHGLRPPAAGEDCPLPSILDGGSLRLDFKRPWSNGTSAVEIEPTTLLQEMDDTVVSSLSPYLARYDSPRGSNGSDH
jgi:hypothetical protein